jgi:hypothetical protein
MTGIVGLQDPSELPFCVRPQSAAQTVPNIWKYSGGKIKHTRRLLFFNIKNCISISVGDPDPQDLHVLGLQDLERDPLVRGTD